MPPEDIKCLRQHGGHEGAHKTLYCVSFNVTTLNKIWCHLLGIWGCFSITVTKYLIETV